MLLLPVMQCLAEEVSDEKPVREVPKANASVPKPAVPKRQKNKQVSDKKPAPEAPKVSVPKAACPKPQKSIASMFLKPQKKKSVDKPADAVTKGAADKASELRDSPGNYSPHHTALWQLNYVDIVRS